MSSEKIEYITPTRLKSERQWTDASIKKYLDTPDAEAPNPYYKTGPCMKLYALNRVMEVEQGEEFKTWLANGLASRKVISDKQKEIKAAKRKELLDYIESLDIKIPLFKEQILISKAVEHYNELWASRGKIKYASCTDNREFLDRICVNYLRHEFNDYDAILVDMFGQIGKLEGYTLLKYKILEVIAKTYPKLAYQCKLQGKAFHN